MRRRLALTLLLVTALTSVFAQGPNNSGTYYKSANGQKGKALKTALHKIIEPHTNVTYNGLYAVYEDADKRADGKLWDMYSSATNYNISSDMGSGYKKEGDCYNREHTVPQSWFKEANPMKADAFHVVPTDGYVNNRRGSYPYGEVNKNAVKYESIGGLSKVGTSRTSGYSGVVFEPADEYKGDFARIYFYMATCYEGKAEKWGGTIFGTGDSYKPIVKWQLDMLMRWAKQDPVSQKEIDRNEAVYKHQKNRNPFVDYPGLEEYVWGALVNESFSYDKFDTTVIPSDPSVIPGDSDDDNTEPNVNPTDDPNVTPSVGETVFTKVTSNDQLVAGKEYLIVNEQYGVAFGTISDNGNFFNVVKSVNMPNNTITTAVNVEGKPYTVILGGSAGQYTMKLSNGKYLSLNTGKNYLQVTETASSNDAKWTITASSIKQNSQNRFLQYNSSSPRFACYTSGQKDVQLYVAQPKTATAINSASVDVKKAVWYNLNGQRVSNPRKGVYVKNGKKYIIK